MRSAILTGAFTLMAAAAFAGSPEVGVVDPDVISAAALDSSANDNWVGVLLTFITIVMIGIGG